MRRLWFLGIGALLIAACTPQKQSQTGQDVEQAEPQPNLREASTEPQPDPKGAEPKTEQPESAEESTVEEESVRASSLDPEQKDATRRSGSGGKGRVSGAKAICFRKCDEEFTACVERNAQSPKKVGCGGLQRDCMKSCDEILK